MELVYYWIDNNGTNLKDIELNFGEEYILKYNKLEKILEVKKNEDYINNFFNINDNKEIVNITGIIGKNGAGKSSVLDYIKGYFYDGGIICEETNEGYIFNKNILAIKDKSNLIIFINDELVSEKSNIVSEESIDVSIVMYGNKHIDEIENYKVLRVKSNDRNGMKIVNNSEILQNIACIYMSNIFDMTVPDYNSDIKKGYYDISTNGILDELEKGLTSIGDSLNYKPIFINEEAGEASNKFKISSVRRFKLYRMLQQLKYISDNVENYEYIQSSKFNLPQEIMISTDCNYKRAVSPRFYVEENQFLRCEKQENISGIEKIIYSKLEFNIEGCNDPIIRAKFVVYKSFINRTIDSYFNDIQRIIPNTPSYNEKLIQNIKLVYNKELINKSIPELMELINENMLKTIEEFKGMDTSFNKFNNRTKAYEEIKNTHESYCKFIEGIEEIIFKSDYIKSNTFSGISNIKVNGVYSGIIKEEGNLIIRLNEQTLNEINKLINLYANLDSTQDFMIFMWRNISSGEYSLLDTYSKLYSLKEKIDQENILIIIDEGELYLHPEWQRQYVNILMEYIPKIYKDKNIQIILASNSPFLISDIPRNNIIVLDKEDGKIKLSHNKLTKQTFGANISKLLGDTFFMENTMGVFSRHKIQDIIDILKSEDINNDKKEYVRKVTDLIEEPIIKRKLKELYNNKYGNIEEQIKELDSNIDKLIKQRQKLETEMYEKNSSNGDLNDKN